MNDWHLLVRGGLLIFFSVMLTEFSLRVFFRGDTMGYVKDDWTVRLPEHAGKYSGAGSLAAWTVFGTYYSCKTFMLLMVYAIFRFYRFFLWDIWNAVFKLDGREWVIRIKEDVRKTLFEEW